MGWEVGVSDVDWEVDVSDVGWEVGGCEVVGADVG